MVFLNLWQGRTGRLPYLIVFVVSSAAIAILPFIVGKATMAFVGGPDPGVSILRSLLNMLLLGIGLLITGAPLVFFARRRMRELGLSGVWLLLFPIGPLEMLFAFAITIAAPIIWPLPVASPVMTLPFWCELAFGAALAMLPSGDYLEHSPKPVLRFAHLATTCKGRLSRQSFALCLAIALGVTIAVEVIGALDPTRALVRPGEHSRSIFASVASPLLTVFVTMFVTSATIRRLHDLDRRGWWIILFPFGLTSMTAAFMLLATTPQLFAHLLFGASTMFFDASTVLFSVQGLGCLILLVWLLLKRGSDVDNPYGPPVDPPNRSYSPA